MSTARNTTALFFIRWASARLLRRYPPELSELSGNESIANAMDGDDVARFRRRDFKLLPQLGNVVVYCPGDGEVVIAPHFIEQLLAGHSFSLALDEVLEDLELARREVDALSRPAGFVLFEIQLHLAEFEGNQVFMVP